jgi:hypothetical protein
MKVKAGMLYRVLRHLLVGAFAVALIVFAGADAWVIPETGWSFCARSGRPALGDSARSWGQSPRDIIYFRNPCPGLFTAIPGWRSRSEGIA